MNGQITLSTGTVPYRYRYRYGTVPYGAVRAILLRTCNSTTDINTVHNVYEELWSIEERLERLERIIGAQLERN